MSKINYKKVITTRGRSFAIGAIDGIVKGGHWFIFIGDYNNCNDKEPFEIYDITYGDIYRKVDDKLVQIGAGSNDLEHHWHKKRPEYRNALFPEYAIPTYSEIYYPNDNYHIGIVDFDTYLLDEPEYPPYSTSSDKYIPYKCAHVHIDFNTRCEDNNTIHISIERY